MLLLTPWQESKQAEIELKEDDPHALEGVLRHIYDCLTQTWTLKPWDYWLDLAVTADKYLEPSLSRDATVKFQFHALTLKDSEINITCLILRTLQNADRYLLLEKFAVDLTMANLHLLENEEFRAQVYSCKEIMLKLLERLSFAVELVPEKVDCPLHGPLECYRTRSAVHRARNC